MQWRPINNNKQIIYSGSYFVICLSRTHNSFRRFLLKIKRFFSISLQSLVHICCGDFVKNPVKFGTKSQLTNLAYFASTKLPLLIWDIHIVCQKLYPTGVFEAKTLNKNTKILSNSKFATKQHEFLKMQKNTQYV